MDKADKLIGRERECEELKWAMVAGLRQIINGSLTVHYTVINVKERMDEIPSKSIFHLL
jgi:hypothetical protein